MEFLSSTESWLALITLVVMEIVLGIDNIVFITIQTDKLPIPQQKKGRILGLAFALITRIILLLSITWIMSLTKPVFNLDSLLSIGGEWHERLAISGRDIILFVGGLFLLYKSIHEIHESLEGGNEDTPSGKKLSFLQTVVQIGLLDIVFGLDSVITAVGMADHIEIMVIAVVISMIIMIFTINAISDFISNHPSIKMLALAFLLLIGITLIAESIEQPISKGYIYSSMAFSIFVEFLVIRANKAKAKPVELHKTIEDEEL
ncbi:TerC family protein [Tenacibaculum sp. IB213877]|uniref:TerC family protein n=1 Tax=Tenacibaculum sp. IB213877 TaxID=3097351 RepID=UPI002A599FD2|nr:TerC family protein [Tenacibaculum sp. IB213877]MDY0779692.1 TerC family protein [Tenacibaculum sp. IB213877]